MAVGLLCLAGLLSGCASSRLNAAPIAATSAAPANPWRFDAATWTLPRYLGSNGAVFHPAGVQHTSLILTSATSGVYGKAFLSVPLGDRSLRPNYGRETDVAVGWNGTVRRWNLNGEATLVDVSPPGRYRGNVVQLQTIVSHDVQLRERHTLSPYSNAQYIFPTMGGEPKRGYFSHNGANYLWSRSTAPAVAGFAEILYDSGVFGLQSGTLVRAQATMIWKVQNHWKLQAPVIQFATPLSRLTDGRRTEVMTSFGVTTGW